MSAALDSPIASPEPAFLRHPLVAPMCEKLRTQGFVIQPGGRSRRSDNVGTVRVEWHGVYVGYIRADLVKAGRVLGYRFNPGTPEANNPAPPGFRKEFFCREHGFAAEDVFMHPDAGNEYLSVLKEADAMKLMRHSAAALDKVHFAGSGRDDAQQLDEDRRRIESDPSLSPTTRKALVDARLGQGKFRQDLEGAFGGACACTGLTLGSALRASHIVAWSDPTTTDAERLDPDNGLLLSANLDALFDRYLITFGEKGAVVMSSCISEQHLRALGPVSALRQEPTTARCAYLRRHNKVFAEREELRKEAASRG